MKLKTLATLVAAAVSITSLSTANAAWPDRPVTIIVPAGAGGGTDATGRLLAAQLKDIFGQTFNVVNQGQGGGVIGITNMTTAAPDGYTLGILYNYAHYKEMKQGDFTVESFTPIAQFNFDPAGFHVKTDSKFKTLKQALDDIKADPVKYNIACGGGCGGSWPLAVATLLYKWGVDLGKVNMIPGPGAAAALQELAAGGVDVVPSSIPEAGALLNAGKIRGLAVFGDARLQAFPNIPTLKEETGLELSLGAWRGVVGPAGLPAEITAKLEAAVKQIYDSKQFQDAMISRGFGLKWRNSKDFRQFMVDETKDVQNVLKSLKL